MVIVKWKVESDLSNYTAKPDFKNITGADISKFAKVADSTRLKSEVDKLDIDVLKIGKLKTFLVD